jgi:predicted ATPase/DNA-binding SARP family transcriptional activator
MNVRLELLGKCALHIGNEDRTKWLLRTRKGTSLLALLVLKEGGFCEPNYLQELLWPDPADFEKRAVNYRKQVSRIRAALGIVRDTLVTNDIGIRWDALVDWSDLGTFLDAIRRRDWQRAIDIYAGPLLPGCSDGWADEERERLRQLYLNALAERASEQSAEEALITLDRWKAEAPEDEEPIRQRWQRLVVLNRQSQALAEAEAWCARNDAEPETKRILEKLRTTSKRKTFPPLPSPWTELIGREAELSQLVGRVRGERLVTLCGEGGIGKTRMALELACRLYPAFDEQVAFVDLSSLALGSDAQAVWAALEQVCGESKQNIFSMQALFILDNAEHILPAVGEVVLELLNGGRELQLLLTSRKELGYRQERKYRLHGLAPRDAKALFLRISPLSEQLDDALETAALENICSRIEGWPLAIELVASRREAFGSLGVMEANLEAALLEAGASPDDPTIPERSRTLQATLEWSARQLNEPIRSLWQACASFAGGISSEALAGVARTQEETTRKMLEQLTALSLVRHDGTHFRLLEPVRAYLRPQETTRAAFAAYFLKLAESGVDITLLETERANLLAAGEWLMEQAPDDALRFGAALWRWWHRQGNHTQALIYLRKALAQVGDHPRRIEALLGAGALAYVLRHSSAEELGKEALDRAQAFGNIHLEARAWLTWGLAALGASNPQEAAYRSEQAEALFSTLGDPRGARLARGNRALAAEQAGDLDHALTLSELTLAEFDASGEDDDWLIEANNLVFFQLKHNLTYQAAHWLSRIISRATHQSHRMALLHGFQSALGILDTHDAAILTGGLDRFRNEWGLPLAIEAVGQNQVERWRREAALGESAWKEALQHGSMLPLNELIAFTLSALKKL